MVRVAFPLLLAFATLLSSAAQSSQNDTAAKLGAATWQLVKFEGGDGRILTPPDKSKYTLAFAPEGRVSVRIDCNRGAGTWKSSGPNQLEFGPLALTRAMCPPDPLNDRMVKDWAYVRSFTTKNGHLFLSLMADAGIYEFEPQQAQAGGSQPVSSRGPVNYQCGPTGDGTFSVTFFQTRPAMVLVKHQGDARPAFQVEAASGARYEGQDLMFWDKGGNALISWSGLQLTCTSR